MVAPPAGQTQESSSPGPGGCRPSSRDEAPPPEPDYTEETLILDLLPGSAPRHGNGRRDGAPPLISTGSADWTRCGMSPNPGDSCSSFR
ncbi:hypothetical protein EYF80_066417 [Liparis tanakae]|uniref:Uncharacterized protein n=1 Tax=Liparis tanakae TaxID=230148 RepID=A0A4Z2E542_9TELE|nr:hypothetical protein EYF80_066417 [Liparis tanakae]